MWKILKFGKAIKGQRGQREHFWLAVKEDFV